MNDKINLVLISDEIRIVDETVKSITVETENNGVEVILPNHIPFLSKIKRSVSYTTTDSKTIEQKITTGFVYTNGQACFVVVDNFEKN